MSTPIGEHDVCRYMEVASKPDGYRRMDTIPWAHRSSMRHVLEGMKHQIGDLRTALANGELNAEGAVVDVQRMINGLTAIKNKLEGK